MTLIPKEGDKVRFVRQLDADRSIELVGWVENVHKGQPIQIKFFGMPGWISITKETNIEEIRNG